jgi:hypothetical protein
VFVLVLGYIANKTEFETGGVVIGDDVITRLEYTSISDMHAMFLMYEDEVKLTRGAIISEIVECFIAAVLEVSGTRL